MSINQKSHQNNQAQKVAKTNKPEQRVEHQLNQQQMLDAPETMRADDVLAAQQQFGNQVVQRALDTKQRRQVLTDEQGYLNSDISDVIQQKRGGGSPLPDAIHKDISQRFKRDFGDVRLHTDDQADELSRAINARAFTIGKDIFFKRGVFAPNSSQGRETLMHELTHVVQQSGSKGFAGRLKLGAVDSVHEQQADRIGKQNSGAGAVKQGVASGVGVQTLGEEEEELQKQELDEEELQMQELDEEELQMQELDEEELQTQELDEEELQMQESEEEEELQMQPDVTGIVQRDGDEDEDIFGKNNRLNYKAYSKQVLGGGRVAPGIREQVNVFGGSRWDKEDEVEVDPKEDEVEIDPKEDEVEIDPKEDEIEVDPKEKEDVIPPPPPLPGKAPKKPSQWAGKTEFEKKRGKRLGTSEHLARLNQLGQKSKANTANEYLSESKAKNEKTQYSRENLLKTIKDPSSSSEDVAEAQDMLKTLHKNTGFFGSFKRNVSREATGERLKKLKEQARGGDKAAYDKYKKEYEKASTYEKYSSKGSGGKTKMIGSGILSFGKKLFGGVANDFKTQLFGAEKEEPKAPAPSPVTVNVGGAGGNVSGGLDMLAKYVKENEQLKTKIAELEKEQK